jgi:NADPH:quinone reductase-like Zn-dependent oxidoreductase
MHLTAFGLDKLRVVDTSPPGELREGEVLVRLAAASINPRDSQIARGQFTPDAEFPLVPLSDGAGVVTSVGTGVTASGRATW